MDVTTILANVNTATVLANATSNPAYMASAAALTAGSAIWWRRGKDPLLGAVKWYLFVIASSQVIVAVLLFGLVIAYP
jgi:hypothetical protein